MSNFKLCQYSCDINNQINICARQKKNYKQQQRQRLLLHTNKEK